MSELEKILNFGSRLNRVRHYETTIAISPLANDADVKNFTKKLKDTLPEVGGTSLRHDDWGKKRLPHPMEKHSVAQYFYMRYVGTNDTVKAIERLLKIEASVLRFLTVSLSDALSKEDVDVLIEKAPREPSGAPSLRGDEEDFGFDSSYAS